MAARKAGSLHTTQREESNEVETDDDENMPLLNEIDNDEKTHLLNETDDDEKTQLLNKNDSGKTLRRNMKVQVALCVCILLTELCEKLSFNGMATNLVPFCEDVLKLPTPVPTQIVQAFLGFCFFLPMFGGWVADAYLGRFNTIYGSSLIYFVGCSLMTFSTYSFDAHGVALSLTSKKVYLAISLLLIAIGTGGIEANVAPFGADQIRSAGEKALTRYFNWFYWFINLGGVVAYTVVAYVQQEIAFFYGYLIATVAMFLAILFFLAGRNFYVYESLEGSAMSRTTKIIWHGVKIKCSKGETHEDGTWLDQTKVSKNGTFSDRDVEDVKSLFPIVSIFLTFIVFWILYGQYGTSYLRQGTHMKLKSGSFQVPAASLAVFGLLSILVLIPVMDIAVYPALRYCGLKTTPLRKIGVGMLFCAASTAVAGVLEIERKNFIEEYGTHYQTPFDTPTNASSMFVLYQAPQFMLMGISDILITVPATEFAYSQSPESLRGVVMGVCIAMTGLGLFSSVAVVSIVRSLAPDWYPENLNTGSLENFFFVLMGLMLLNFIIFLAIAVRYKYVADKSDSITNEFKDSAAPDNDRETA